LIRTSFVLSARVIFCLPLTSRGFKKLGIFVPKPFHQDLAKYIKIPLNLALKPQFLKTTVTSSFLFTN